MKSLEKIELWEYKELDVLNQDGYKVKIKNKLVAFFKDLEGAQIYKEDLIFYQKVSRKNIDILESHIYQIAGFCIMENNIFQEFFIEKHIAQERFEKWYENM